MTAGSPALDHNQLIRDEIAKDSYSADKLAKADNEEVKMVADVLYAHHTGVSPIANVDAVGRLVSAAIDAYADPRFGASKSRKNLENIGSGKPGA